MKKFLAFTLARSAVRVLVDGEGRGAIQTGHPETNKNSIFSGNGDRKGGLARKPPFSFTNYLSFLILIYAFLIR